VTDEEQLEGLDLGEHGNVAYGGFVFESTGFSAVISPHDLAAQHAAKAAMGISSPGIAAAQA
jgi:hypothetical protein